MSEAVFATLLSNALFAALLGLCGWIAARPLHRPALAHTLFALALLKLVTPPLLHVDLGTRSTPPTATGTLRPATPASAAAGQALPQGTAAPTSAAAHASTPAEPLTAVANAARFDLAGLAALLWSLGSLTALVVLVVRTLRFRRLVRLFAPADASLIAEVEAAQRLVGLRRTPRVLTCDARLPPAVFAGLRGATLLVPNGLVAGLDRSTRTRLWMHELAHVRRGDVWLRWFEAAVQVVLWWHPLRWWLVRELRAAEERVCDAWATAGATSAQRRGYCDALLAIAGSASTPTVLAASAAGAGTARRLQTWRRRLEDVMTRDHVTERRAASRFAVALLAAVLLPLAIAQEPTHDRPETGDELDRIELEFRVDHATIEQWTTQLAQDADLNLVIEPSAIDADRRLTTLRGLRLPKASVRRVLDVLSALTDLRWSREGSALIRIYQKDEPAPPSAGVRCHGAFAAPGVVPLADGETLLSLVTRLRLTDRADLTAVQMLRPVGRGATATTTVDVDAMLRTGNTGKNLLLRAGDVVTVPERLPDDLPLLTLRPGAKVHFVVPPELLIVPGAEQLALLTETQRVQRDGTIFVPFVGPVHVDGLSRDEVSDLVTRKVQEKLAVPVQVWARLL